MFACFSPINFAPMCSPIMPMGISARPVSGGTTLGALTRFDPVGNFYRVQSEAEVANYKAKYLNYKA